MWSSTSTTHTDVMCLRELTEWHRSATDTGGYNPVLLRHLAVCHVSIVETSATCTCRKNKMHVYIIYTIQTSPLRADLYTVSVTLDSSLLLTRNISYPFDPTVPSFGRTGHVSLFRLWVISAFCGHELSRGTSSVLGRFCSAVSPVAEWDRLPFARLK